VWAYDPGKLVIGTHGTCIGGHALAQLLRDEYYLEIEMAASDYVIAMTSLADTDDGFARLADALCRIDARLSPAQQSPRSPMPQLRGVYAPWQIADLAQTCVPIERADGYVAAEYVWAYPPGIPLVVPGESVSAELTEALKTLTIQGTELHSTSRAMPNALRVVKEQV
jgi:arginine/lysine/ornithine decarboxylase